MRDVADQHADAERADQREQDARQQHREQQALEAELRDRGRDQHDEGAGGAPDLVTAAAQGRHQGAADDGGVEAALRRDARRHRDRHGERQCNNRHGEGRQHVLAEGCEAVAFQQAGDQLWLVAVAVDEPSGMGETSATGSAAVNGAERPCQMPKTGCLTQVCGRPL
jgi:hypothetical protein